MSDKKQQGGETFVKLPPVCEEPITAREVVGNLEDCVRSLTDRVAALEEQIAALKAFQAEWERTHVGDGR